MTQPVEGRVFARLLRFQSLPADLQRDTKEFQEFLVKNKSSVFKTHKAGLMKSAYSVKGKKLIKAIEAWLQGRQAGDQPQSSTTSSSTDAASTRTNETAGMSAPTPQRDLASAEPRTASPGGVQQGEYLMPVPTELRARAREIAESLVLSGFLTPHDDDIKSLTALLPDYYVHDLTLLIPVANELSELNTTSVWSVLDGAIYAKTLKRKAGMLGRLTGGKDVYVVFNTKTRKAYLFHSDLAREAISELDGEGLNVQLDDSSFEYGVRVSAASDDLEIRKPALFGVDTKQLQEEFLAAWLHIGARNIDQIEQKLDTQVHPRAVDANAGLPMHNLKLDDTENTSSGSNTSHRAPDHTTSHLTAPFHHGTHGKTDDQSRGAYAGDSGDLNRGSNTACQAPGHTVCPMCDSSSHSQTPLQQGTYGNMDDQSRGAYTGGSGDLNRGSNTSHHAPGHSSCPMCDSTNQNPAQFHPGMKVDMGFPSQYAKLDDAQNANSSMDTAHRAPEHTSSHTKSPFTHGVADNSTKPHGQEWFGREPGRAAP